MSKPGTFLSNNSTRIPFQVFRGSFLLAFQLFFTKLRRSSGVETIVKKRHELQNYGGQKIQNTVMLMRPGFELTIWGFDPQF